jgi:hypothetical protein
MVATRKSLNRQARTGSMLLLLLLVVVLVVRGHQAVVTVLQRVVGMVVSGGVAIAATGKATGGRA